MWKWAQRTRTWIRRMTVSSSAQSIPSDLVARTTTRKYSVNKRGLRAIRLSYFVRLVTVRRRVDGPIAIGTRSEEMTRYRHEAVVEIRADGTWTRIFCFHARQPDECC